MSFSCPKFILTIHLVVGVFSLWLLIGQPQLHTKDLFIDKLHCGGLIEALAYFEP